MNELRKRFEETETFKFLKRNKTVFDDESGFYTDDGASKIDFDYCVAINGAWAIFQELNK